MAVAELQGAAAELLLSHALPLAALLPQWPPARLLSGQFAAKGAAGTAAAHAAAAHAEVADAAAVHAAAAHVAA
eukprot:81633-Chlamydomonas_euryale.AAC.1